MMELQTVAACWLCEVAQKFMRKWQNGGKASLKPHVPEDLLLLTAIFLTV